MYIPLVPAYIWAGNVAEWAQLLASRPGVAVINPDSGPGIVADDALLGHCGRLLAAGWKVVGYVATTYCRKPVDDYYAELAAYRGLGYPIVGAFHDEIPSTGASLTYMRGIHGAARTLGVDGPKTGLSIFNPGAGLPDVANRLPGSVWVTYEGPESGYWPTRSSARQAHLVYDDTSTAGEARMAGTRVGYGYATPDTLPNPWDTYRG